MNSADDANGRHALSRVLWSCDDASTRANTGTTVLYAARHRTEDDSDDLNAFRRVSTLFSPGLNAIATWLMRERLIPANERLCDRRLFAEKRA